MKSLRLENSPLCAPVDDEDYDRAIAFKWYINHRTGYAYGYFGNDRKILLHRFVLGLTDQKMMLDHRDDNRLNCCKSNLRVCNNQQNTSNKRKSPGFTSKFKGVSREKRSGKWRATIVFYYKQTHIGLFDSEPNAALAYDHKAKELFGEFARLNFPEAA